ncbi:MAG: hypothetical protein N4A37_07120 [Prolixibacteraceae bacterium]|jgi:hypothetical protein|nr:hypothetical protein [Prolixibacteraceae bacterium]
MLVRIGYNIDSLIDCANKVLTQYQDNRSNKCFLHDKLYSDSQIKELSILVGRIEQTDQVMKSFLYKEKPKSSVLLDRCCVELDRLFQTLRNKLIPCGEPCDFMKILSHDNTWNHIYPYWIASIGRVISSYHAILDMKEMFIKLGIQEALITDMADKFREVISYHSCMADEMGINEEEFGKYDKMIVTLVNLLSQYNALENESLIGRRSA